jgi:4-amino-4-deoxy-L-arabinose transferase-like glycosyltransferase
MESGSWRWAYRGLAAAAALLLAALYCLDLGHALGNGDEAVYAEFVRAMQRSGDYLRLEYLGAELLQRPPTSVALYAGVSNLVPGELGIRLAPALLTLLTYAGIGAFVWRRTGRLSAGVLAMLVGATVPTVWSYGRVAFSDPPFVVAVTVALLATIGAQREARWLAWAGGGLGAAVAFKSLAAVIPALALGPWLLAAAWRHRAERRRIALAVAGFVLLAAPYYAVSLAIYGGRFYREHIERILVQRASGDLDSIIGLGGPLSYVRYVWVADGAVIAALVVASIAAAAIVGIRRTQRELLVPATYCVLVFLGLSAVGTRLGHYLLVFYPGVAVCVGLLAGRLVDHTAARFRLAPVSIVAAALAVTALSLARPPIDSSILPSPTTRALGRAADARLPPDAPIYTLDWYAPAMGYYADRRWHMLVTPPRLARALGSIDPFLYTGTIHAVPPFPPGELYIAATPETLGRAPVLVLEVLAEQPGLVLVRARAL